MYSINPLILLLIFIYSCQNSGGVGKPESTRFEMTEEVHPLLKEGSYQVAYSVNKEVTQEQKKILQKLEKQLTSNENTQQFFEKAFNGEIPKFTSSIGISMKEYNGLRNLFSYNTLEKGNGVLTIMRQGNELNFKGQGRLSLLDSVKVKVNVKTVSFKQYNLSLTKDSIDLSNEDIPKGDTLDSYEFYVGPDGILGLTGLEGTYELLLSKLRRSGKTFLYFFARQPENIKHPIPEYITVIFD